MMVMNWPGDVDDQITQNGNAVLNQSWKGCVCGVLDSAQMNHTPKLADDGENLSI
jgi:hypothetical protein